MIGALSLLGPQELFGNVTRGAVPSQADANVQCVVCKTTEKHYYGVHQYQRQTRAERQHRVENIALTATGMSPLFILSLEAAKIAVTPLISFPRYLVHK